ncbi:hypothetical protein GOP47_0016345 [Adiantum capillus-veneris]|uniref:Transmembrane protein n=1 Tax=Adiantum capillus-veneris TaxID=13818 RepID=A0A9D4UHI1_ADICA|nr:hypothetical protein GOP47_0016345 [Adiantum capillus-veneris]
MSWLQEESRRETHRLQRLASLPDAPSPSINLIRYLLRHFLGSLLTVFLLSLLHYLLFFCFLKAFLGQHTYCFPAFFVALFTVFLFLFSLLQYLLFSCFLCCRYLLQLVAGSRRRSSLVVMREEEESYSEAIVAIEETQSEKRPRILVTSLSRARAMLERIATLKEEEEPSVAYARR